MYRKFGKYNKSEILTRNSFYRELGSDLRLMGSLNLNKFEPGSSLISSLVLIQFKGVKQLGYTHMVRVVSVFWAFREIICLGYFSIASLSCLGDRQLVLTCL